MPRYQYAAAPSTPPALTTSSIAGNITTAAGTYSFWLQTQSRGGFSLVSARVDATIASGTGLRLTIPASALPTPAGGVDIRAYSILCSSTTDPFGAVIIAAKPGFDTDGTTRLNPPFTIDLTENEHLNLAALTISTSANLPSGGDRLNGMRRSVDDLSGTIYEWSDAATAWLVSIPQAFTGYTTSVTGGLGASQSLAALTDLNEVIYPSYDLSGFSEPVKYWLTNNESAAIAQGKRIGVTVSADIEGVDTDLTNLAGIIGGLELTFLGFANATTGVLDTTGSGGTGTMAGVDEAITYVGDGETGLILQKDLPAGSAYVLQIRANFDVATLTTLVPDGTVIKITPTFFNEAATINDAAMVTGSVILGEYDRRRLVPTEGLDALALNGSGILQLPLNKGYSFKNVGQQTVAGLLANTADQNVVLNVSGDCIVVSSVPDYAALRAIVGTVDGQGKPTDWSAAVTLSSALYLSVEVTYPTAIRLDYDDIIAGNNQGTFNADIVRVYVRPTGGGNAVYWDFPVTPDNASDTFTVGTVAGTDSGGTEPPARPNDRFGLYEPADDSYTPTPTAGASVFTSQDYEVAIAFRFDSTITSLDHRPSSGCITEVDGNLADLFQLLNYLGTPVDSVWDLRSITTSDRASNKEVFCAAQGNPYRWQAAETTTEDADYLFSTTTTPGPAAGQVRLNNATLASVTTVYLSETDGNSTSVATLLDAIAENQTLRIQSVAAEATYAEYVITAVADSGTYRTLTVTHSSSNGTLSNSDAIVVSWGSEFVRPFDIDYPNAGRWVKDDSDQILVLQAAPTAATGETGDLAVIANDAIAAYGDVLKKSSATTWTTLFNFLPYSLTTANFTQPAVDANVTVSVRNSRLFPVGAIAFVEAGGEYVVISKPTATSLEIQNRGLSGNAAEASTISSGARIYIAGRSAIDGTDGISAISTTTANFTQPAEGGSVAVTVNSTAGFLAGQYLYTDANDGNTYEVAAVTNATTLSLTNLADYGNAAAGATIASGSVLVPTGRGASGGSTDTKTGISETTTTRTLLATDAGQIIECDNASPVEVTIPANATTAIAIGKLFFLGQKGAGRVILRPASPATVNGLALGDANQIQTTGQWGVIELRKMATDAWWASQDWEFVTSTYVSLVAQNLVAWYSLDEASGSRADSHSGGLTLTEVGTVPSVAGKIGNAFSGDGTAENWLERVDNTFNFGAAATELYIAAWFNKASADQGNILIYIDSNDDDPYEIWSGGNYLRWSVAHNTNGSASVDSSTYTYNAWHLVEVYWDGPNNEIGIAIDNGAFTTTSYSGGMGSYPGGRLVIGAKPLNAGGATREFDGLIDEVAIYDTVPDKAPSGALRAAIWNSGNGVAYSA